MSNRRQEIYEAYQAWKAARDAAGTVEDLCASLKITRQRLYKVVSEVEGKSAEADKSA